MSDRAYAKVQGQQETLIGSSSKHSLLQRTCVCGQHTSGGDCTDCRKKREGVLQRRAATSNESTTVPSIVSEVLRSPRQPLDANTHGFKETRFGHDFSQVRNHSDAGAAQVPRSIVAEAFRPKREASECVQGERTLPVNTNRSSHPLPFLDTIQRSFGHHDLSRVHAHTDSGAAAEARSLGAEAFARGSDVTFSRMPSLHTAAHEAAHVIQQRTGVDVVGGMGQEGDAYEQHADEVADQVTRGQSSEVLLDTPPGTGRPRPASVQGFVPTHHAAAPYPPVIQLRRVPPNIRALLIAAVGGNAANFVADAEGAQRLIDRAMAELASAQKATVLTNRRGALTEALFNALPKREQLSRHAEAILALFPDLQLGDPNLIDTGPRPVTADAANINTLVTNAQAIFNAIASGAQDTSLTQVFGAGSLVTAKAKYAAARTWMNSLHGVNKIVTDRSGYADEVFQGGLTSFHVIIRVSPSTIDNPNDNESIVTLIHESMHAGNVDIGDNGYINAPQFTTRSERDKLLNAAHFEVVPRRILGATDDHAGETFIPAGTTVGGVTAPLPTAAEQGARDASERLRIAWALGLNLHLTYVQLFRRPTDWMVPQPAFGGIRFDNSLPFWSKVQKLTIHQKTTIDPASPDEAKHPVSQIDIALSEGLTRKLALAGGLLDPLQTQTQILAFETAHASAAELSATFPGGAHTNANAERDFLLRLAVRDVSVAPMTGDLVRDLRVVQRQGDPTLSAWNDILRPRSPSTFTD